MKGIDVFCASQVSTPTCLSTDQASSSSSSNTIQLGGRAIDRHNPIITETRRTTSGALTAPRSSSQPQLDPKPHHDRQKAKKNSCSKPSDQNKKNAAKGHDQKKKKSTTEKLTEHITHNYSSKPIDSILRRSWVRPSADLITPPGSSRYLLADTAFFDGLLDFDPVLALTKVDNTKPQIVYQDETNPASKPSGSSRPKSGSSDQVVVLRVSLHCKGCEGKVRKHLSRMQGTSYVLRHRLCGKESDSSGRCDSVEGAGKHIKGEECTILASICLSSWNWYHRNKENKLI